MLEKADRISFILILFDSTLNSINVPPLKSIPKFKPLKIIRIKLIRTKTIEIKFAILNFFIKL